ncbi:MAG: OmpH family outer membrane protein [Bernardetiaceae bacterium]|nr:OmpH family outer membrane protein [Bernardetiaceae bacterium]
MGIRVFSLYILFVIALNLNSIDAKAQRFAFFDSDSVLKLMPEYAEAKIELEQNIKQWETEVERREKQLNQLRRDFEAEKVLLTPELLEERKKQIADGEKELRDYQAGIFGYNGQLFRRRKELMTPLRDQIVGAARKVAAQKKLNLLFDRSSDLHIVYYDDTYNFTDLVIAELGLGK